MKLLKSIIIVCSAVGVYSAVKKYRNKSKPVRKKRSATTKPNKYKSLPPATVRQQFKQRIAAGEWLTKDEYLEMMDAMKEVD